MVKKHLIYLLECKGKFYVGRTCNFKMRMLGHRYTKSKRSKLANAIKKYGWASFDVSVLEDDLTFEEAVVREPYFISLLETVKYGYNILPGGAGYNRDDAPMKTIRKIRAYNIKTKETLIFETVSDAAEELDIHSGKISAVLNKTVEINRHGTEVVRRQAGGYTFEDFDETAPDMTYEEIPKVMSEDAKEKIGASAKGRGAKGVIGYHVLGYTVEFDVIKDAEKEFNLHKGEINKCAKGKRGSVGGFTWKYKDDKERAKYPEWDITRKRGANGRPVYRILEDGTKDEYPSIEEAARVLCVTRSNIRYSMKRNGTAYGYRWVFVE